MATWSWHAFFIISKKAFMKKTQKDSRPEKSKRKTESLEERVHRHINDITSVITEEDIRNVKTEPTVRGENTPEGQPKQSTGKKRKAGKQKKENEADTQTKQATPWNILSEGYD
jgi:hypothetical protein